MNKDCEKIERLISDRLDGEILPADELALQAHLNICEECRHFEESAKLHREHLRSLPDAAIGAPSLDSSERKKDTNGFWVRRISLRMPIAAALAVLMLSGWLLALLLNGKSTKTSPSRPILVQSVQIIKARPAQLSSVKPDYDSSLKKKEDET